MSPGTLVSGFCKSLLLLFYLYFHTLFFIIVGNYFLNGFR